VVSLGHAYMRRRTVALYMTWPLLGMTQAEG
jgi:hypothetical protein